jgi:23S rRNA (uridine2479-2'-O)-methyltransferase
VATVRRLRSATDEFQLAASLLTNRRQRSRQRRFVVEGVRAVNEAVAARWPLESFWYASGRPLSRWARALLEADIARTHYEVAPALMAELSGKDETSELLAVAEIPPDDPDRISLGRVPLVVAFDRPSSPGNLGSVIRTAEAFGADGLLVSGHGVDVYDPVTVRATVGALFSLPVVRIGGPAEVAGWLDRLHVVGTSAHGSTPLADAHLTQAAVVVLGNEAKGLSNAWLDACDEVVAIPMRGRASSLNVAAGAAIVLYDAVRRRSASRAGRRTTA